MSQPGICTFCHENIVCATKAGGPHHPSYSSLTRSARQRCAFCKLLHEDVTRRHNAIEKFALAGLVEDETTIQQWLPIDTKIEVPSIKRGVETSLYRWSVRSLGRTRETKAAIAITFRVIPQRTKSKNKSTPETSSDVDLHTFDLPERVFYCFPENELGALLSPAKLGTNTNPDVNEGHQIKSWIRTCGIEHSHCPKRAGAGAKFVPTRLLHVGGRHRGDRVRVMNTAKNKIKGPYVTLSHCWGPGEGVRKDTLRSDNFTEFHDIGVPWNYLSRTFKQAIEVARFLEIDYIWIDSLCIIQGSDPRSREDWEHEGSLMHKVYRNSYCNIAAADSENSTRGLFRSRNVHDVFSAKFESGGRSPMFGERVWRAVREDLWDNGLLKRPLYRRGWVFQERMLAPRILHFSQYQVFWDCAEMSACETLPAGLPLPLDRKSASDRHWRGRLQESGTNQAILLSGVNDDAPEDFWRMAVESYTSLDLKFQTDKRRAFWGIAKLVRDYHNCGYAAGMWSKDLEEQLAWRVADCAMAERPKELTINPSWSWTSVKGRILIDANQQQQRRIYRVTDPNDQPLSFRASSQISRPVLTRDPSESLEEELVAMGKELELVDERRRKSSASSRQNSQSGVPSSRHNSQSGTPSSRHNSSAEVGFTETDHASVFGRRAMSPQQGSLDLDGDEDHASGQTTRQNSITSSLKAQDTEPELVDKRIAIQGHIRQGVMKFDNTINGWTFHPNVTFEHSPEEFSIEAYPDIQPDVDSKETSFIILALSEQFEKTEDLYYSEEPSPVQKSWYVGHGIMVQSTQEKDCYVRTGALLVRHLSVRAWMRVQEGSEGVSRDQAVDSKGESFFLV